MNHIKKIIADGYEINTEQIYEDTFRIFKKMVFPAAAILLMLILLLGCIYMLALFSIFKTPQEIESFLQNLALLQFSPEILAYYLLASAAINGITSVFSAGFMKMAHDVYHNKLPKFGTPFTYFTKVEGFKIFVFSLLIQLIYNAISIGLESIGLPLVNFFILILLHLLTLLVVPFLIFEKLSITKALTSSIAIINQRPFKIMSFLILLGFLSLMGIFMFMIGIIFTLPIFYCFNFSIYQNIVNKN